MTEENTNLPCMTQEEGVDTVTCRPRTPNDPYTRLTDTQIRNIQKQVSPHFHIMPNPASGAGGESANGPGREGGRHYVDRYCQDPILHTVSPVCKRYQVLSYARVTNAGMLRGYSGHSHFGWIDEKHSRFPDERYNSSRPLASVKWGPNKAGERTRSHFYGESIDRYTTIDMYRRNPTNYPGRVVMDHGRPGDGYYAQKYPCRTTFFGSSVPLNRTDILTSVYPKTLAQYKEATAQEQTLRSLRKGAWPEYSEYTSKYLLRTPSEIKLSPLEEKKRYLVEANS